MTRDVAVDPLTQTQSGRPAACQLPCLQHRGKLNAWSIRFSFDEKYWSNSRGGSKRRLLWKLWCMPQRPEVPDQDPWSQEETAVDSVSTITRRRPRPSGTRAQWIVWPCVVRSYYSIRAKTIHVQPACRQGGLTELKQLFAPEMHVWLGGMVWHSV